MYGTGIIDLRQITENAWKARYQGNYGVYTIKITTKGKKTVNFSCSCPSDYYPCKHIPIVEEAIERKMKVNKKGRNHNELRPDDFIKNVSVEKLREFIIAQAKYNTEFYNAVMLEFSANIEDSKYIKYSKIIQKALVSVPRDENDYYVDDWMNIDVMDQWLEKAKKCVLHKEYNDAVLICKAIIEEYSQWLYDIGEDISHVFSSEYQSAPFEILKETATYIDKKDLFQYCLSEFKKGKYAKTEFYHGFQQLLGELAITVDQDAYIALQDELLGDVKDKSSYEAEVILQRKINYYRNLGMKDKAWAIIKENLQIDSFRLKVVKKMLDKQKFRSAKKLINDYFKIHEKGANRYFDSKWNGLLLDIAQKEEDTPAIRAISYKFIEDGFDEKYYQIYKTSFSTVEWKDEKEKLFTHYYKEKYFNDSAADLLAAENDSERLLNYIKKHFTLENLENYYKEFASDYPEKTLEMFKKALIPYADRNTGRSHYEHILSVLKKMSRIKGGEKVVSDLIADFRIHYKNRRAMMEILSEF